MWNWNKFIAALIGLAGVLFSGDEMNPAPILDVLPPEYQWIAPAVAAFLVAAFPNGRPAWEVHKPTVGS